MKGVLNDWPELTRCACFAGAPGRTANGHVVIVGGVSLDATVAAPALLMLVLVGGKNWTSMSSARWPTARASRLPLPDAKKSGKTLVVAGGHMPSLFDLRQFGYEGRDAISTGSSEHRAGRAPLDDPSMQEFVASSTP